MTEDHAHTKIPRFDGGCLTQLTKARPSSIATSKLAKPRFILQSLVKRSSSAENHHANVADPNKTSVIEPNEIHEKPIQPAAAPFPRKTFIRRFGAANKISLKRSPILLNQEQQKQSSHVDNVAGSRTMVNETIELTTKTQMMDATKTISNAAMDQSLTRSNTFVCDDVDDTQAKLLSITHNVNAPTSNNNICNDTITIQQKQLLNKERTFKRSLSPIYGDTMNAAKRKNVSSLTAERKISGPLLISTPLSDDSSRRNGSENRKTFTLDSTVVLFDATNDFSPDAIKLNAVPNSTMQSNRVLDLTHNVATNASDACEECTEDDGATKILCAATVSSSNGIDANAYTETIIKSNALNNCKMDDVDSTKTFNAEKTQPIQIGSGTMNDDLLVAKKRFSLGLDLPECTLDCSIELCDSSAATSAHDSSPLVNYKPHSYELDESLGILTPDQMIEFLDTNATNAKIDLPLSLPVKLAPHKCRIDQTPSPEELPLDPIEVKKLSESEMASIETVCENEAPSQADCDSKADQMTKSTASKVTSNSFITSVTSIASLDNGYQGDGEMSRPASRGGDNSPMNVRRVSRQNKLIASIEYANDNDAENIPIMRRQDPMTDSDFFTESDADDIFHRGDRRVQIIDGHMYAHGADVDIYIDEPQQNESSCMDSSGIYTDVENRNEYDNHNNRSNARSNTIDSDMSPDGSTDTVKSSSEYVAENKLAAKSESSATASSLQRQPSMETTAAKQAFKSSNSSPTQSTQSIAAALSHSSSTTINDTATPAATVLGCACEKQHVGGGCCGGGERPQQQCVISDASPINNNTKTTCTNHSVGRSDNDKCKEASTTPSNKTTNNNNLTKVKKSSPNRKQTKNDTNVLLKRNELAKIDTKSVNGVKIRTRSSGKEKKSTPPPRSVSPSVENGGSSMNSERSSARKTVAKINKWDAVMNKIALNKAEVKTKNYSEVKSKVTCGIKRNSPKTSSEQSTASDSGISSAKSDTPAKPSTSPTLLSRQSTYGITAKRSSVERDISKDSVQFGRDISASSSPTNQGKSTNARSSSSARKRHERTVNNIQNGFSPANVKVDGTTGNVATTTATTTPTTATTIKPVALHKRYSPNNTIQSTANTTSLPPSEKRVAIAPTSKKSTPVSNKRVNQTQNAASSTATTTTPTIANKSSTHAKEHNHQTQPSPPHSPTLNNNTITSINNNHITGRSGTNSSKLHANGDQQPAAILASIHHRNGKPSSTTIIAASVPKIQTKQQQSNGKTKPSVAAATTATVKSLNNGELNENLIMALSSRGGSDTNDTIDYVAPALAHSQSVPNSMKQKQQSSIEARLIHANKGIVAMSILIQHLTHNLNAFETPSLRSALEIAKDNLVESQQKLNTMLTKCSYLEEQAAAKDSYFASREHELKEFHERELERVKVCLYETEKSAKEQIQALQYQLTENGENHVHALKACQLKADARCSELETQLQLSHEREAELVERLNNFTVTENQLRDKVQENEQEFAERLQASVAREREMNEKLAQLTRQLQKADEERREADERSRLLQDEMVVMRQRRSSSSSCSVNGNAGTEKHSSIGSKSQMLEEEVESLRSVLELKQNEISDLRKQNHELQSAHDELPKALLKISVLESRLEDLSIQFQTKVEEEKDLALKNRSLQDSYQQEVKNRTRLTLHNEELQWKLKQNSEKFTTALNELSKSYQDRSNFLTDCKNSLYGSLLETTHENTIDKTLFAHTSENVSPPSSPVIKGVVEKSDSVSYVLEINDDESAEAMASRAIGMVKRAGSFRCSFKEKSPSFKRQLSIGGTNPLSQSASASSLMRQHSDSPNKTFSPSPRQSKSSRMRSNSLSVNSEPKKVLRSPSGNMPNDYAKFAAFEGSLPTASSPIAIRERIASTNGDFSHLMDEHIEIDAAASVNSRTRSSSVSTDDVDVDFPPASPQPSDSKMSHSSSRRNDLCAALLPQQKLKKCQQIKESAGEAMVSSVNSEDDQSFGSGSDVDSMSASSSSATSPSHTDVNKHGRQLTIDEEALMHKIVASLSSTRSTPMEVSWSEDADNEHYAHESSA